MSSIHILTETKRIENKGSRIYKVFTPEFEQICRDESLMLREHERKLQCGRIDVDVSYSEIHDQEAANGNGYLIVPEFLIPGRPYPIYVYLYAITTYCYNPTMGQREAAKRTRERFELKTFSYTTLGRAMKKLEKLINESEPEEIEMPVEAGGVEDKKFSTVDQMKDRKEKVAAYLKKASTEDASLAKEASQPLRKPEYTQPPYTGAFIEACHSIVRYTFLNYHRLLL